MLNKTETNDKIEVFGPFDTIMVRAKIVVSDDGEVISETYRRFNIEAGETYEGADARILGLISSLHTPEVIAAKSAFDSSTYNSERIRPQHQLDRIAEAAEAKAIREAK